MTLPSNHTVGYTWANSQVTAMRLDGAALIANIGYQPFGGLKSWTFANGEAVSRLYDTDGRLIADPVEFLSYDAASQIINRTLGSFSVLTGSESFSYDALDRLIGSEHADQNLSYAYDASGNRTAKSAIDIVGGTPGLPTDTLYSYGATDNRLTAIGAQPVTSDDAGNLVQDRAMREYVHDAQGRLQSVSIGGIEAASYTYNALGQRTHKRTPTGTTTYLYAQNGQFLGLTEYSFAGDPMHAQYYIWLGSEPVAAVEVSYGTSGVVTATNVLYLHADHLETPRLATNANQIVVWKLPQTEAFGAVESEQDPDMDGIPTEIALRFPGQYFDRETGLHYNWHRYYDPETGRYTRSDPIGLGGGLNTYAYALNNPLSYIDPYGLWAIGDPLPQRLVDSSAGFGDTITSGFGLFDTSLTQLARQSLDVDVQVNKCSGAYRYGRYGAYVWGAGIGGAGIYRGYKLGHELSIGKNFRVAPFGNRTGHPIGRWPHYHRSVPNPAKPGESLPGQGIGRHRPWETKQPDTSFWDRF